MLQTLVLAVIAAATTAAAPAQGTPSPVQAGAFLKPERVRVGRTPSPDPVLATVAACISDGLSQEERRSLWLASDLTVFPFDVGSPLVKKALSSELLESKATACDPRLANHRRYALLSGAALIDQESALERLRAAKLTRGQVEAAWASAPTALQEQQNGVVSGFLDQVSRPDSPASWAPLFRSLKLRPYPKENAPFVALTPAQAAVRDYIFASRLGALIDRRVAEARPQSRQDGVWILDYAVDSDRYFPSRARELEVSGHSTVECTLTASGALTDCGVVYESPTGAGFGPAGERVAKSYRFRMDHMPDGAAGKRVRLSTAWTF